MADHMDVTLRVFQGTGERVGFWIMQDDPDGHGPHIIHSGMARNTRDMMRQIVAYARKQGYNYLTFPGIIPQDAGTLN